ncbi:hypothetical protein KEM54_006186 [Ascosphaera aggregata]|nr:hypothetical protein KEM54_006186 [Ascosphaera aggregata]
MAVDPLSPIAPARLRALLVPVGRIKRSRFLTLAKRLQSSNIVRLGDVSPDGKPNDRVTRHIFSPLAFPTGMIVYDLDTSLPPASHIESYPFELFREPLVIIAIADGVELTGTFRHKIADVYDARVTGDYPTPGSLDELHEELNYLKTEYPRSILQQLLVFDYDGVEDLIVAPERTIWIPNQRACRSTTIKTALCDMTASLLWEMNKLAELIRDMPMVESPKLSTLTSYRSMPTSQIPSSNKAQQRMTMPVQLPSRSLGTPGGSDESGSHISSTESPITFDEITRAIAVEKSPIESPKPQTPSRFVSPIGRERMSLGGAMPMTEKMKQRVKGRRNIALGALYLLAGRWPDALKELSEGASVARINNDYIWHAKALELILLCLLLFGWAGMDFQIPTIFYPMSDKSSHKSLLSTSSVSGEHGNSANRLVSLQNLVNVLPDVFNYILNLYWRATNMTDEPLPQLLFSETVIRLSRVLCAIYLRDGRLDDDALRHIVMNDKITLNRFPERPRDVVLMSKVDVASFVLRALPPATAEIPVTDSATIFIGIASVLSILGMERKKAFILREAFSVLIPGLVQARKVGAAEMGIHPAAGLQVLNTTPFDLNAIDIGPGDLEKGVRSLLYAISGVYGVAGIKGSTSLKSEDASIPAQQKREAQPRDSTESIVSRVFQDAYLRAVGDMGLKIDILRSCINFCEALPDFKGVLQFTVNLLRVINQFPMLSAGDYNVPPALPREEQIRLLSNIQRTVGVAEAFGAVNLEDEYWDDCLVRGIRVSEVSASKELVKRSKADYGIISLSDQEARARKGREPFIYNPFAKIPAPKSEENLLIAGEPATFRVILQNPFEFDVEIESLSLEGNGVPFEGEARNIILAPVSIQEKSITVTAKASGTLNITACIVKVKYCRQRRFPIFDKYWHPGMAQTRKVKTCGLEALDCSTIERPSRTSYSAQAKLKEDGKPSASTLKVIVLQPQPLAVVEATSLSQSALVILEGETKDVTITVQNTSSCPVDFLFFTFQDSSTQRLQAALQNKELQPADIYELEAQLITHSPLRWKRAIKDEDDRTDRDVLIPPHSEETFTVEVYGKPGLFDAVVQIDYGFANSNKISDMPEIFYSRRLSVAMAITVNASIEIVRSDILPFSGNFNWLISHEESDDESAITPQSFHVSDYSRIISQSGGDRDAKVKPGGNEYCLMVLDLCNAWPTPITISLNVLRDEDSDTALLPPLSPVTLKPVAFEIHEVMPPGQVCRFVFPVPRLYIANPTRQIPSLSPLSKRQFVVSAIRTSYDAEVATREMFWYRERLIGLLSCSWKEGDLNQDAKESWGNELGRGRRGIVDMRNLRLPPRILDSLRVDDLEIGFDIDIFEPGTDNTDALESTDTLQHNLANPPTTDCFPLFSSPRSISRLSTSSFRVPRAEFLTLKVFLQNNSPTSPIHPLLRLQPSVRNQPHTLALDIQRRLAWSGMLQQGLQVLPPKSKATVEIGLTALCPGEFEIGASVEEIRVLPPIENKEEEKGQEQETLEDKFEDMSILGGSFKSRRIWHSRVPCVILAS